MVFLHFDLFQINGQTMSKIENNSTLKFLNIDESLYKTRISNKFESRKKYQPSNPKMILSVIPGTVLDIIVFVG